MEGLKYTDQENVGRWNYNELKLDSDVEAIQLIAKKTGATTNVEYVLVDVISIDPCFMFGMYQRHHYLICSWVGIHEKTPIKQLTRTKGTDNSVLTAAV